MIVIYIILKEIIWLFVWVTVVNIILFGIPIPKIVSKCKHKEYIYIADSMKEHVNSNNKPYNRRIPISDFKKIWLTSKIYQPLMFNLFFEMKK